MITLAYEGKHGYVTDLGEPKPMTDATGRVVMTLPRYGVWKHTGRKFNVVLTTDDRAAAMAAADREGHDAAH
jgi:hypothetical protein